MKIFFSRIGKSFNMLKRNGIIRGSQIVWMYFIVFIKALFVGSGDVLYVTGGVGDSARYRAYHTAEELGLHGFKCSVTVQDNPRLLSYADKFKIFVFHRTIFTPSISKLISKIKEQEKEMIFDTDDLVFDPVYLSDMDYYKNMTQVEKNVYKNGIGGEIIADSYLKVCTTTTEFLAEKLREKGKKVFLVENKLTNHDLELAEKLLQKRKSKKEEVMIGYFSGTASHNKDFASILPAIMEIMKKYSNVKLYLAGPLDTDNILNKFEENIVTLPFVPRDEYFENISKVDINLAPLELGNPFCESKSEIKFSEPGLVGVPTVAVRNRTFSKAITDGVDGFLADNTSEWIAKISQLVEDENLRKAMGEKAREKVLRDFSNKNSHNEEYYNYLRSKL